MLWLQINEVEESPPGIVENEKKLNTKNRLDVGLLRRKICPKDVFFLFFSSLQVFSEVFMDILLCQNQ